MIFYVAICFCLPVFFFLELFAFLPLVRKKDNCFEDKNKILQFMKSGYIGQRDFDRKTLLTLLFRHVASDNFYYQSCNYRTVGLVVFNLLP